ncbi:MAG: hypothetical protein AAB305_05645 [Candidatus Zixiibacteriota bacterium]
MTAFLERTGLDLHSGHISLARVRYTSGRPMVMDMKTISDESVSEGEPLLHLSVGVPNACVVAKQLRIPELLTVDPKSAAQYELSLLLLDPPKDYLHELIPTESPSRWLGLALKRECAEELNQRIESRGLGKGESVHFCPRSVALGKAIMTFAIGSGGDYFVAVEIDDSATTLAFLQGGRIVDVGQCALSGTDWSSPASVDMAMRDIRTVIALHQSRLFSLGITTPLTQIVLSGLQATEEHCKILQRHFPGLITIPRLNAGFFAEPAQASQSAAHRYLVPLGLALE